MHCFGASIWSGNAPGWGVEPKRRTAACVKIPVDMAFDGAMHHCGVELAQNLHYTLHQVVASWLLPVRNAAPHFSA
jgi:hypothetical protein